MAERDTKSRTIGRDASTGRFISVSEAAKRPKTTMVETFRVGKAGKSKLRAGKPGDPPPGKKKR